MSKRKEKTIAMVTILDAASMTVAGRKEIAKWLRRTAYFLVKEGHHFTHGRYAGRYLVSENVQSKPQKKLTLKPQKYKAKVDLSKAYTGLHI